MDAQLTTLSRQMYVRLMEARRPLLIAHRKPDGDTLGAMMAVYNFLRDQGREAYAYCVDRPAKAYGYFPRIGELVVAPETFKDEAIDLICVFDAGDLTYAGVEDFVNGMARRPHILNFDHHVTNTRFGDQNLVIVTASSTAEVVHRFMRANGVEPSRAASTCLMTGILTDTSNFSNPGTTTLSLSIAADLLLKGVSIHEITRRLMRNKPMPALKLWGKALERLRWDTDKRVASTALTIKDFEEHPVDEEYVEGLSNFLNHYLKTDVVLVLRELPGGKVKGSFRSGNETDVSAMAAVYGGGGHKKAAGFTVVGNIVEGPDGWKVDGAALQ